MPDSGNLALDITLFITIGLFIWEMIELSFVEPKSYFNTFYFYADLLGTVSIIFDIDLIMNNSLNANVAAQRTTSATRLASRAARILKLQRIIKVYSN